MSCELTLGGHKKCLADKPEMETFNWADETHSAKHLKSAGLPGGAELRRALKMETVNRSAAEIDEDARLMQRGDDSRSNALLQHAGLAQKVGYLDDVAQGLAGQDKAKVQYDSSGQVSHLVFNPRDGGGTLDIDVAGRTINGRTQDQLRQSGDKRVLQYIDASMKQPHSGESMYPAQAIVQADRFAGAILNNNMNDLKKAYQGLSGDTQLQKSVEGALKQGFNDTRPVVSFDAANGSMRVQSPGDLDHALIFQKDGSVHSVDPADSDIAGTFKIISAENSDWGGLQMQSAERMLMNDDRLKPGAFPSAFEVRTKQLELINDYLEQHSRKTPSP